MTTIGRKRLSRGNPEPPRDCTIPTSCRSSVSGEQDGLQYYVMQFIQGLGLDQVLVELRRLQQTGSSMPRGMRGKAATADSRQPQTAEQQIPAHADVSADAVARSLMYGRLGETLLLSIRQQAATRTAQSQADVKEKRSAGASIDADFSTADQRLDHRPGLSDTVAGVLSETARSGEIPLPGQSQVSSGRASRMPYWRSVATIVPRWPMHCSTPISRELCIVISSRPIC